MSTAPAAPGAGRRPEFSHATRWYVLWLLFVVYVFNFIDRQILAIVLDDVKRDLGVSDTAMGVLSGPAFALFYTAAGVPIARLADRSSRRVIIALGLAVWSAMTAASGLARSFAELAAARVGVGIGEAAGSPPAHALLSDLFPPERRATALSIYAQGIYVGAMLAYLGGGIVKELFDWRTAYLVVGLPGLLLALLVWRTVPEPTRGWWEPETAGEPPAPFRTVAATLFRRRSFVALVLAASCQALAGYAFLGWAPAFLGRVHGMGGIEIGWTLGLVIGFGGSAGAWSGGALADRLAARDVRWTMRLCAIVSLAGLPFAAGFLLLPHATAALVCFVPFYVIGAMYVGPLWSMGQSLVRPHMRATASAVLLLVLNIVGLGLGPFLVGAVNDLLQARFGETAIRWSLLLVACIGALAAPFFAWGVRHYPGDLAAARAREGA